MKKNQKTDRGIDTSDRVAALERRLRRTQLTQMGVIAAGLCGLLVGFAQPQDDANDVTPEIRTRKLVVVDDQGVPRIHLGYRGDYSVWTGADSGSCLER